jgi:choline dehydrogenase-like flavoprotein
MAKQTYDAIVIGSGVSGGWAAKELTEKGLKVLMLERGHNVEHVKDYVNATRTPWENKYRGYKPQQTIMEAAIAANDKSVYSPGKFSVATEVEGAPYTQTKPFNWYRSYNVGGKSLTWGRQSYRFSEMDFEANAKEGIAIDWPIRYKDLAPWYSYVEKFAGISGNRDGLAQLPDGEFMPPIKLNCVEQDISTKMTAHFKGKRTMISGRTANLTRPLGERNCLSRSKCALGCPYGGYFSTQSSTLPAAMKTGRLTLRPLSIVTRILYDRDKKKATGVEIIDAENNQTYQFQAKVVFVCASTLNSTWVLMNSATDVWPDGLGSSSGELGYNLMDHHLGVNVNGQAEGFDDKYVYGRNPSGIYVPRFRNMNGEKSNFLRGYGYQGSANRSNWARNVAEYSIGVDLMEAITEPGKWHFGMGAFGEMLPYHENKITLNKKDLDKWGLPTLSIDCELKENEKQMRLDMLEAGKEILEAGGLKNVTGGDPGYKPGGAIHEVGTARMGHDPKTSVLNKYNQVWDAKNVFVTDGSCFTSSACQNPSLTFMAMTARAADYAVSELKKQNI